MHEPVTVQVASDFAIEITLVEDNLIKDISGATVKQIILTWPSLIVLTLTASFVTDGTDGKLIAAITAAQNVVSGTARCQGKVTISGKDYFSTRGSIDIKPNLA